MAQKKAVEFSAIAIDLDGGGSMAVAVSLMMMVIVWFTVRTCCSLQPWLLLLLLGAKESDGAWGALAHDAGIDEVGDGGGEKDDNPDEEASATQACLGGQACRNYPRFPCLYYS